MSLALLFLGGLRVFVGSLSCQAAMLEVCVLVSDMVALVFLVLLCQFCSGRGAGDVLGGRDGHRWLPQ